MTPTRLKKCFESHLQSSMGITRHADGSCIKIQSSASVPSQLASPCQSSLYPRLDTPLIPVCTSAWYSMTKAHKVSGRYRHRSQENARISVYSARSTTKPRQMDRGAATGACRRFGGSCRRDGLRAGIYTSRRRIGMIRKRS